MDLKETDILGVDVEHHWYYVSKARAMMRLLGGAVHDRILDVGAGSGFFSRYLLTHTTAQEAWCVDISYENDSDETETETGKAIYYRRSVDSIDADLVLLMDVLEHVDDDVCLLNHYVNLVPRGTRFLISVPAFQVLWSDHDDFLEHKRRYQLNQIEAVAHRAGLTVKNGTYYFCTVFPIAAVMRLCSRKSIRRNIAVSSQLSMHHPLVNSTLTTLCSLELPLMGFNRIAGLTAFCLAEKN